MVCHDSHGGLAGKVRDARMALINGSGAGVGELLPAEEVQRAVEGEGVWFRECLFTPLVTLWTFLFQVLDADGSCRAAVARLLALLAARGEAGEDGEDDDGGEPATGPYCKARQRLPEPLIARLAKEAGGKLHARYPAGRLLGGRPVKVVDGTTVSMPDTKENQKLWPQPPTQKPGLGFPLARLVAVISLNCAAVLSLAIGPYAGKQSGETALFRTLLGESFQSGDVLLADRYYASFWMIAMLLGRGVDSLMRQHQKRSIDFRAGVRLGHDDHLIILTRPSQRPEWMDQATYEQMPAELTVREVRVRVAVKGFRVRQLVLVTTLLDAQLYTKDDLPRLHQILLRAIARHRVGDRPGRYEPRAVKRRAKPIALLTVPREQARKRLAKSGEAKC